MGKLSVGAKDARKGRMILCSEPKSLHSLSITNPLEKGWVRGRILTQMDLASLALVFEKEGREEGNSTPAVKGVWGKSTYSSGSRAPNSWKQQYNRKTQFWGQDIQTLDPAGLSMDFYFIWTSQSQITSLQDLFEPCIARAFFSGFLTTEVHGSALEKSGFPPFSAHILINFLIHSIICAALFLQNFLKTNLSSSFYLSLSLQWYPLEHLHATMGLCS